jgi:hypothetical protein
MCDNVARTDSLTKLIATLYTRVRVEGSTPDVVLSTDDIWRTCVDIREKDTENIVLQQDGGDGRRYRRVISLPTCLRGHRR